MAFNCPEIIREQQALIQRRVEERMRSQQRASSSATRKTKRSFSPQRGRKKARVANSNVDQLAIREKIIAEQQEMQQARWTKTRQRKRARKSAAATSLPRDFKKARRNAPSDPEATIEILSDGIPHVELQPPASPLNTSSMKFPESVGTSQVNFEEGQEASYTDSHGNVSTVKVAKVHCDGDLIPYYTVLMPNMRERQTDEAHLSPLAAADGTMSRTGVVLSSAPAVVSASTMASTSAEFQTADCQRRAQATTDFLSETNNPAPDMPMGASSPAPVPSAWDESPAEVISNLTRMGFPEAEVRACLRASNGNPRVAVKFLMDGIPSAEPQPATPSPNPASSVGCFSRGASGSSARPLLPNDVGHKGEIENGIDIGGGGLRQRRAAGTFIRKSLRNAGLVTVLGLVASVWR